MILLLLHHVSTFHQFAFNAFADATVYIPSFDGTSYLELRPLAWLLQRSSDGNNRPAAVKDTPVFLHLTVKTRAAQGTILYSEYGRFDYEEIGAMLKRSIENVLENMHCVGDLIMQLFPP